MQKLREVLEQSFQIDFLHAVLSGPREKDGVTKVKVRPILKQGVLFFQFEAYKNNQVFHENYEAN